MILVIATVMIAATATLTITTQDAFAYESSQAGSLANACGNGEEPFNILCQNLMSEIQGDGNAVNIIGLQTGGERTPRGSPTEPPVGGAEDTCVTCFTRALSADEQQGFLGRVFLVRGEINVPTLEEFCKTVLSRYLI